MSGNHWIPKPRGYESAQVNDLETDSLRSIPTRYKRYSIFSRSEWLEEISTCILSLALFAGIVAIFQYVDGEALSVWTNRISLNALISVLTTACSASLMHSVSECISQLKWLHFKTGPQKLEHLEKFDEASRGPLGSLKLLGTVKWDLVTVGALITICRLAFAPLTQQVVMIESRLVRTPDDNVSFGYAHAYDRGVEAELFNHREESYPQDPGMQSAVLQGLYDINTPPIFSCPGACGWQGSFVSLGFKTECKNVTEATMQTHNCTYTDDLVGLQYCSMTTPGGLDISTRHWFTDLATNYRMNASSNPHGSQTPLSDNLPEIVRFAIYRSTSDHNFRPVNINVTECSLSLTAYNYTAAHANGSNFFFEQVQEVDFGEANPWNAGIQGAIGSRVYTNETNGIPALELSMFDVTAAQTFFTSEAIVTEWVDGNWVNSNIGLSAALIGDVDLGARFDKMAASMTDYLRSGPNKKFARGERLESELFYSIRWYYLLGPAAIELVVLIFTVVTIAVNRESRNVPLWKSSVLAVLACQHEEQSGLIQTKARDIKELKKRSEKELVRLS